MTRFLLCTQPLSGHVSPVLPVVAELTRRGHGVTFLTGAKYHTAVEGAGARHAPIPPEVDYDDTNLDVAFPDRAELAGIKQFRWDIEHLFIRPAPALIGQIEALAAAEPFDVLVADPSFVAARIVHRRHGVPWATFSITALTIGDPLVPPFGLGLRFNRSPIGVLRNRLATAAAHRVILRSLQTKSQRMLGELGEPVTGEWLFDLPLSPQLVLQPSVPSLEYPRRNPLPQVHFVGALLPPAPSTVELPPWWDDLQQATRVVLVTQGTAQTDPAQLILPTLEALAHDSDTLVVGTIPGRTAETIGETLGAKVPSNARLAPFIPFSMLMPHVDVMITNGGFGGVHWALSHGVPLIVAGSTEDKPEVANRVEWAGVGINLRTSTPRPKKVAAAVQQIRSDAIYRQRAAAIAAELGALDAARLSADLLEDLVRSRPSDAGATARS